MLVACKVLSNTEIAPGIYDMLADFPGNIADIRAGQFAELFLDSPKHLLPRPISICEFDKEKSTLRFVYQIAGDGTRILSELKPGGKLRVIAPLGNGYIVDKRSKPSPHPGSNSTPEHVAHQNPGLIDLDSFAETTGKTKIAVVGGGVGVPPMLGLTKELAKSPKTHITAILGFRSETMLVEEFEPFADVHITTDDGSRGYKGNCVDFIRESNFEFDVVCACGPKIMLKYLAKYCEEKNIDCFVSLEERMGCGVGACVGCALPVKSQKSGEIVYKKLCKDGPVFDAKEVVWD